MEYIRQLGILDPSQIGKKSITLVGAGATGSYVALALAQLGWGDIRRGQGTLRVFDGDVVKAHNLSNQLFDLSHIGKSKADSLKEIIMRKCGFEIEAYNQMVDDSIDPKLIRSNYVFLLTDTMSSRKEIFDKYLEFSFNTDLVIETRMGLKDGRVYAFDPNSLDQKAAWRSTLYSDQDAEVSACGSSQSIITTVMFLASLAAQRVVHHFNFKYGSDNLGETLNMWYEVQFSLYPEFYYLARLGDEPIITVPETKKK